MPGLRSKSVLVTGGAGFIGSHLVERLIREQPSRLTVLDNFFLGREENLDDARASFDGLRVQEGDATDYAAMEALIAEERVDVILDLATIPLPTSLERPRWSVDVNTTMITVMCELLRLGRYERLVHFSSSEVYGTAQTTPMDERHPLTPLTPYAASKAAEDHIALAYHHTFGVDISIVRPFNAFGPRQNDRSYAGVIPTVIRRALQDEEIVVFGDGEQTRDFLFVNDLVDAAVALASEPGARGRVVNVCSGTETSVNELVRLLATIVGSSSRIVHGPARPGDVRRHAGDASVASQLVGFAPSTSLEEGLRRTVEWYAQRPAANSLD